jgi:general secretion pathway protein J
LLAITLLSILLALTYSGLMAATRAADRGETMLADGGEMRAAHEFVRRQLNQMLPLAFAVAGDRDRTRIMFSGDAEHIEYVAPMPGYLGTGGPQVQQIELAHERDGEVLQFSHALLQGFEQDHLADRDPVVLLRGIRAAEFEFLGRDEQGGITDWSPSWDEPGTLPVAVRLRIEFSDSGRARWPDLVAQVRIDNYSVTAQPGSPDYSQRIRELIQGKRTEDPE